MNTTPNPPGLPVEILIVEDSATQAQRLEYILQHHDYHVITATNGRLALEAARRRKPTLIISDVIMPEMDGYELCHQVKSDVNLADTPLILVTTLSDPQDVIRGLECRADHFILKPYDELYLLNRVRFVLANREVRQAEPAGMGVEIFFNGHKHFITADRLQILNLLLSTYDAAIQRNKELSRTQQSLRDLNSSLEAANQELDAFTHSVSHDLRAPIRAVRGLSQTLLNEAGTRLSEGDSQLLRRICSSAEQMGLIIESLLNLSRLGRQPLSRRPVNMTELAQQVLDEQRDQREGRRVEVRVGALPDCIADPMLLKQVWVNLLSNAFKYTRQKERAVIEVGCRPQGEENAYFVRDNGAGFDMKYAARLFGAFQRLHSSEEFEGIGVGLSIVQRIIQRHGGRIWAESLVDNGATFYFALPNQDSSAALR